MKILFVISKYYPKIGGTPNCLRNIVNTLKSEDEVQVLTTWDGLEESPWVVSEGVAVHKVKSYKHIAFSTLKGCLKKHPVKALYTAAGKVLSRIFRVEDTLLKNQFTRRIKKLHKTEKYDWVVAVSGDIVPARAVLSLKDTLGKICFYQLDPYTTNTTLPLASRDSRAEFEKKIHEGFDLIFTTDIIRKEMSEYFTLGDNVRVLSFPTIKDRTVKKEKKAHGEEISFLYCGAVYAARNADSCLRVMDELTRLDPRFVFDFYVVGDTSALREYADRNERIRLCPPVSPEKIHRIMNEHDVLVNIGNVMTNQVPSKIYDYISTGRPIVNFIYNKDCPTLDVLKSYPSALTISPEESVSESAQQVKKFVDSKADRVVEYPLIEKLYYENTVTFVANEIISDMRRLEDEST